MVSTFRLTPFFIYASVFTPNKLRIVELFWGWSKMEKPQFADSK